MYSLVSLDPTTLKLFSKSVLVLQGACAARSHMTHHVSQGLQVTCLMVKQKFDDILSKTSVDRDEYMKHYTGH